LGEDLVFERYHRGSVRAKDKMLDFPFLKNPYESKFYMNFNKETQETPAVVSFTKPHDALILSRPGERRFNPGRPGICPRCPEERKEIHLDRKRPRVP
jgi:hypothetical protein